LPCFQIDVGLRAGPLSTAGPEALRFLKIFPLSVARCLCIDMGDTMVVCKSGVMRGAYACGYEALKNVKAKTIVEWSIPGVMRGAYACGYEAVENVKARNIVEWTRGKKYPKSWLMSVPGI
jgi:hypothetical protein